MPLNTDRNKHKSDKSDNKTTDTKKKENLNNINKTRVSTAFGKVGTGHLSDPDKAQSQRTHLQGRVKEPTMTGTESQGENKGNDPKIMDKDSIPKDKESYIEGKDPTQFQGKIPCKSDTKVSTSDNLEIEVLKAKLKYMENQITQINAKGYTSNVQQNLKIADIDKPHTISKCPDSDNSENLSGEDQHQNEHQIDEFNMTSPYDSDKMEQLQNWSPKQRNKRKHDGQRTSAGHKKPRHAKYDDSSSDDGQRTNARHKITRHAKNDVTSSEDDVSFTASTFLQYKKAENAKKANDEVMNKDQFLRTLEEHSETPKKVGPEIDTKVAKIITKMFTEPNTKQVEKLSEVYMPENIDIGTAMVPREIWNNINFSSRKWDIKIQHADQGMLNAAAILSNLAENLVNNQKYEDAQEVFNALQVLGQTHVQLEQDRRDVLKYNFGKNFRPMLTKDPRKEDTKNKLLFQEGISENVKLVLENEKRMNAMTPNNQHKKANKQKENKWDGKSKNYRGQYKPWKDKKNYKYKKNDQKSHNKKSASSPKKGTKRQDSD